MSVAFPTEKDHLVDAIEEHVGELLSGDTTARLRRLTASELLMVTHLITIAKRNARDSDLDSR